MPLSSKFFFLFSFLSALVEPCHKEMEVISGSGCCSQNITFAKHEMEGEGTLHEPRRVDMSSCPKSRWTIQPGGPHSAIRIKFWDRALNNVDMFLIEDGEKKKVGTLYRLRWVSLDVDVINHLTPRPYQLESKPNQGIELAYQTRALTTFNFTFTRFSVTDRSCICPKFYYEATSEWQEVSSPNYPNKHCPRIICFYYLETNSPNQAVELDFDMVSFDSDHKNKLWNMDYNWKEFLSLWQRGKNETHRFRSRNSSLVMIFDTLGESEGWHAKFRAIENPCLCPEKLMINNGTGKIVPPGYPDHVCFTKCTYELEAPSGKEIHVTLIPGPRLDPGSNSFLIYWNNPVNNHALAKWRLDTDAELNLISHGSKFSIGIEQNNRSFMIEYEVVTPTKGCQCQDQPEILESMIGSVTAPMNSTSGSYCRPLDCFYLLNRPTEEYKRLNITFQRKMAKGDYFTLTEKYPSTLSTTIHPLHRESEKYFEISVLTGSQNGVPIAIDCMESVMLHFHSNRKNSEPNEILTWNFKFAWNIGCNCGPSYYWATKSPQSLLSPLFPDNYCIELDCHWLLEAPPGHRIVFEIHEKDLSDFDDLAIYDGKYIRDPSALYSRKHRPSINHSSHHFMTVEFKSNHWGVAKGFNATFYAVAPNLSSMIPKMNATRIYRLPQPAMVDVSAP